MEEPIVEVIDPIDWTKRTQEAIERLERYEDILMEVMEWFDGDVDKKLKL